MDGGEGGYKAMTDKIAKIFLKESPINGIGVFAGVDIPKGTPILKIDDSHVVTNFTWQC